MQRLKRSGIFLMAGSCLVIGSIAAAEPVSTAAKKHAECEGSKVKTACNNQADVKDFVKGRQAPSASGPISDARRTAAKPRQDLKSAPDDSAEAPKPE